MSPSPAVQPRGAHKGIVSRAYDYGTEASSACGVTSCVDKYRSHIGNPAATSSSGVILAVALEAALVPMALVAVTVQVYAVPLVSPLM